MIRMRMGDDDKRYLLRGEPILFHLLKELLQVAGMPRIDENRLLAIDDISITIVLIGIPGNDLDSGRRERSDSLNGAPLP